MSKCKEKDCKKWASFNYKNELKALYCFAHKTPEMVNVKDKKCLEDECNIQPHFNYNGYQKNI